MTYIKHFIDEVELVLILASVLALVTVLMVVSVKLIGFM